MEIQIDAHTFERAQERSANKEEISDVINIGFSIPAKSGRMGKAKVSDFRQKRLGKHYEQKRVEAIYPVEGKRIVAVTGKWEGDEAASEQTC